MSINVHPLTNDPTAAWEELQKTQQVIKITPHQNPLKWLRNVFNMKPPKNVIPEDKVRIVCISDTHSRQNGMIHDIPDGDIFIHAGDFTRCGRKQEIIDFNNFLESLPHKHKLVIAGNHELSFDRTCTHPLAESTGTETENVRKLLTNCIYLEDSEVELFGLKFYGSPWQPEFYEWAFNVPRGTACLEKWDLIPDNCDVLITHGPPIGHGDLCSTGLRAGCVELLSTIQQRVKPKYHVFGHIHEGYGISSDGETTFVNASTCDIKYKPINPPIVFDIALPAGVKK